MTVRSRVLAAALGGVLVALAFPPFGAWPLDFVALVLFALALDRASLRESLVSGALFGFTATLVGFFWIAAAVVRFTGLPYPLALVAWVLYSLVGTLPFGAIGLLSSLGSRALPVPLALACAVLVSERYSPGVFQWQLAGALIDAPFIRQSGDVFGVSGLGALLLAASVVPARALVAVRSRTRVHARSLALSFVAMLAPAVYGLARVPVVIAASGSARTLVVDIVQPDIEPSIRWDGAHDQQILDTLHSYTRIALDDHPDLVVWSEAAHPYLLPHRPGTDGLDGPPAYPDATDATIVFGASTFLPDGRRFNSVLVREPDAHLEMPLAKRYLVPFGEHLPLVGDIPWVRRVFSRVVGLSTGTAPTRVRIASGLTLGVFNCFEDTLASVGAELSASDLLLNLTNDAWFGTGPALAQHAMLSRWRAIETGRELVRATNNGLSGRADALGRFDLACPPGHSAVAGVRARLLTLAPLAPHLVPRLPVLAIVILATSVAADFARRRRRGLTAADHAT